MKNLEIREVKLLARSHKQKGLGLGLYPGLHNNIMNAGKEKRLKVNYLEGFILLRRRLDELLY